MISTINSIIIAYSRRKQSLLKCLESIREHEVPSEIIVVDMYDEGLDLSKFGAKYIPLNNTPTDLFSKVRCLNHGVQNASGEYISIVDCDMIISPGWFKAISLQMHPTTVVVTPVFLQSESVTRSFMAGYISMQQFMAHRGKLSLTGKSQITVLRQHLLRQPFREDFIGYGAEDTELNDRLAKSLRFHELNTSKSFYHMFHSLNIMPKGYYQQLRKNRALYSQFRSELKSRLGIYVASHHASKVLPTHLSQIREHTKTEFDYYIADNSSNMEEKNRFLEIVQDFDFVTVLRSPSRCHGETLQYLVDNTSNEYIALFDVDAFPIKSWDQWALGELEKKKVIGILNHVARRELDYHLHPSFMVFHRDLLKKYHLDLHAGSLSRRRTNRLPWLDPAGKITSYLHEKDMFNQEYVEALLPTHVEIPFEAPFNWNGHRNLRRGFGVTYNDMIFHFWFGRNLYQCNPIYDDSKRLVVTPEQVHQIIEKHTKRSLNVSKVRNGFSAGPGLEEAIRQMTTPGGIALDLGSGNLISAKALAENCKQVFSLEESKDRAERISQIASNRIKVLYSPLLKGHYPYLYFGQLDVIVIDGPRGNNRSGCMPWLSNLKIGGLLFVDDTHRPQVQDLVSTIQCMGFHKIKEGNNSEKRTWCVMKKTGKVDTLVDLLMLSYNRSEYTWMTLESLRQVDCGIPWEQVKFTVIDQASTDDSISEIARFIRTHQGIIDVFIVADKNYGAAGGISYFLTNCRPKSSFIGKIDNDSIFTSGWLQKLVAALLAHPKLGVAGAQEYASQGKNNRIMINDSGIGYYPARFVGGRFLARKQVFDNRIPQGNGVWGWTDFQTRFIKGWHIGWCVPASVIEHIGDWNFHHPNAIKNEKYLKYFQTTGRLQK